jgi:hypothetical protein
MGTAVTISKLRNAVSLRRRVLTLGDLPPEMISVKRKAIRYRMAIEDAVVQAKGLQCPEDLSVTDQHHVNTAASAEIAIGVAMWLLRRRLKEMSTTDILACNRETLRFKMIRDAAVKALELDKPPEPETLADYVIVDSEEADEDDPASGDR